MAYQPVRVAAAWLVCTLILSFCPIRADQTATQKAPRITLTSEEQLSLPGEVYKDPEFDQSMFYFSFMDLKNQINIGKIDPATGKPVSHNYRVVATANPFLPTFNSGEWGYSQKGIGQYYTGKDAKGFLHVFRFQNNTITQLDKGDFNIVGNLPSKNPAEPYAYVMGSTDYPLDPNSSKPGKVFREDNPSKMIDIPIAKLGFKGPRFVPGKHAVVTNIKDAAGVLQAAYFDIDTQKLTQLTFDDGNKESSLFFQAAENNNALMFFSLVDGGKSIRVYQNVNNKWQLYKELLPPRQTTFDGVESFSYKGKTFLSAQVNFNTTPNHSQIAVLSIDGKLFQTVSKGSPVMRQDAEVLVSGDKIYIYYYITPVFSFYLSTLIIPDSLLYPTQ
jgi:hypothetical protein